MRFVKFSDYSSTYKAYIFNDILIFRNIKRSKKFTIDLDKILKKYNINYYRYYNNRNSFSIQETWLSFDLVNQNHREINRDSLKQILYKRKFKNKIDKLLNE